MFKILPTTKRTTSSDVKDSTPFHALSSGEGKENNRPSSLPQISQRSPSKSFLNAPHSFDGRRGQHAQTVRLPEKSDMLKSLTMDQDFEKMLDDLQIPTTLRPKLATLESPVKAAMLRSSHVLTTTDATLPPGTPRRKLRRSLSSTNLDSPRDNTLEYDFPHPPSMARDDTAAPLKAPKAPFMLEGSGRPSGISGHSRGVSLHIPRTTSQTFVHAKASASKAGKPDLSPAALCTMLSETSSTQLELEFVKKLRLMLRNETASWSETFLQQGGYAALLTRLIEILEVEWREEQHDDQILHELLRCFKALSTSSIGCFALRSSCPTPFVQLISLLYSDKKPGDLCTRQLIVDLLQILFDVYPATSRTIAGQNVRQRREAWEQTVNRSAMITALPNPAVTLPLPHNSLYSLVRALLLTPAPPPTEPPSTPISPHAFIASLHLPRIFKSYLQELSDVCRDYFWVFCHPQNSIWNLEQTDEAKVERPRAPGGMTGGVEFEAMGYLTSHFHLVNSLATAALALNLPDDNEHSARRLHADLFASGIERVILTTRKASTTYYPTLHLELARYLALAGKARFEIPWTLSRLIGPPPTPMLRGDAKSRAGTPRASPTKSRAIPSGAPPSIPTPRKVEPIKF